ncbi:bifunctional nuclease family protein [Candidatus Contubernalis alkaliaceticus]|uniref:bifunctional nuclease family protein n=1 Tax=Candidatus Contubernalis alkaliaceticus TaxID=338645 RepID=UPI001F4BE355|nr:bifunctional nuclease family protein [Candidatus Contubernalis alkalaceticus]UNC93439.1 bifunctional nuclease family protein [Candidatus Contubernalis alkalaceticus]
MLTMKVKDVVFDQTLGSVVLLVDPEETKILPIWVGFFEAQAIAIGLHQVETPRPMTHDLMNNICQSLGAQVRKVVVSDVVEGTYYALIYLKKEDQEIVADSRPSDAIALALKAGVEILVTEKVMQQAMDMEELDDEKKEELKALLDSLKPDDDDKKILH